MSELNWSATSPNPWIRDKTILVTGASGTVGRGLITELLHAQPRVVRALDSYEHGLFQLQQEIGDPTNVRWLLGDIRDVNRLRRAMEGVDLVFHAAALKHVSIGEYNPFEIVQTNLVGLQNVIQAALENDVERVIFTSSDKAVNPTNAMGASKLMGERLVSAGQGMRGNRRTCFASVRFGNILGSNGSVVGTFCNQIRRGGPLTLTDRRMTRFVMGLEHSVRLVLLAAEMATGGEVFVLKMPALRIASLADVMIRRLAPEHGWDPDTFPIIEIGVKPGEKLYEELIAESEVPRSFGNKDFLVYVGNEPNAGSPFERPYLQGMEPVTDVYHSGCLTLMSDTEIEQFLEGIGTIEVAIEPEVAA